MKIIQSSLLFLLLFVAVTMAWGQETINKLYSVKELQKDVSILQDNLEAIHPGLYTYTNKAEYDTFFEGLKNKITAPMTQVDFYRLVLPLHNKIRNGHTLIIPPIKWSEAVEKELPQFPFDIYEDQGKLYVLRNLSENVTIQDGAEIESINEVPAINIYNQLIDNWIKDGYNRTYPAKMITQDFSEFYANILGTPALYEIRIKQNDEKQLFTIKGLPIAQMRTNSQSRYQHDKRPWYNSYEDQSYQLIFDGTTATMILPTFSFAVLKDYKIDYKQFFKSAFAEINKKGVTDLIIDIRENGGGMGDVTTELFSYLYDKPFRLMEDVHSITKRPPSSQYFDGNSFFLKLKMMLALKRAADNKYIPRAFAAKRNGLSIDEKQPAAIQYTGKVYVLTSGWSFSASGLFTALIKNYNRGVFIGEEAGGNPYCQVGDFEQMLTLPTSGVRMIIPLFYEQMNVDFENTGHGVVPHHFVRNSIEEELSGRDAVMDFTLDLIAGERDSLGVIARQKE